MSNEQIGKLFNVRSHNPSYFSIKENTVACSLGDLDAVIVDESFIDFSDLKSAASYVNEAANLIVVKSMGKSLGWHGVRLGYAVAGEKRPDSYAINFRSGTSTAWPLTS